MHGFDAREFAFFDFPTSSSSEGCRSSSSAFVRRGARHKLPSREARQAPSTGAEKRDASIKGFAATFVQSD
jgi:hypothetical protein